MALPILGALVVPLLWRALPTGGSGARLDVVGAIVVALTAAGMVLLVQSPSAGLLVAAIGASLLVLGVPAVRASVRRRPDGFLPVEVIRNATVVRSAVAAVGGARVVVRDAHRAARRCCWARAGRRGRSGCHGAERRGRAARAAGRRADADPHRAGRSLAVAGLVASAALLVATARRPLGRARPCWSPASSW